MAVCSGPSYPDGKCPTKGAPAAKANNQVAQNVSAAAPAGKPGANGGVWSEGSDRPTPPSAFMPLFLFSLVALGIFKAEAPPLSLRPRRAARDRST